MMVEWSISLVLTQTQLKVGVLQSAYLWCPFMLNWQPHKWIGCLTCHS